MDNDSKHEDKVFEGRGGCSERVSHTPDLNSPSLKSSAKTFFFFNNSLCQENTEV